MDLATACRQIEGGTMSKPVEFAQNHPLEQQIAARAYERWMRRGRPPGNGAEDWFAARAELEAELVRKEHDYEVAVFAD
jgi:Protein of unknown function (DUF2934)